MKLTEIKRRTERIQGQLGDGFYSEAHAEAASLTADFVRAAAAGTFGDKARSLAREIVPTIDDVERMTEEAK